MLSIIIIILMELAIIWGFKISFPETNIPAKAFLFLCIIMEFDAVVESTIQLDLKLLYVIGIFIINAIVCVDSIRKIVGIKEQYSDMYYIPIDFMIKFISVAVIMGFYKLLS